MASQSKAAIVVTDIDKINENHVLTLLREIGEEAIDGDRKNVVRLVNYYYALVKKRAEITSPYGGTPPDIWKTFHDVNHPTLFVGEFAPVR